MVSKNAKRSGASSSSSVSNAGGSATTVVVSEADSGVHAEFTSLCRELNMDSATTTAAWDSYAAIKQNYTLEGSQLHWLACALYVACHNSYVPTVGDSGAAASSVIEGNGVSLTRLLRCCKLSLIQFFNKAKKWADMANLSSQFRKKIDGLERNFAVCSVIFKKYGPIFVDLFKEPARDAAKANRSRKQKKPPCTPSEVFDFTWTLFIRVKTDFPAISDDLVNSFHLLLSCVDYVYGTAVVDQRTDLLNDKHKTPEGASALEPPCVLDALCARHDGIIAEVKSIKQHWWRPHIRKFFETKVLRGDGDGLTGILDPLHFETNCKNVRKDYEAYVLSIGEYDERIFLGEDAPEEIGTPSKLPVPAGADKLGEGSSASRRPFAMNFDGSNLIPTTPLSGKQFLRTKEQLKITPVSTATYLVSRLNNLLCKRGAEPGTKLIELFKSCEVDPTEAVVDRVRKMGDTFCQRYTAATDKHPGSHDSFARMRNKMAVALYYKLLEAILYAEKKKNGSLLANLLSQELFHMALFACCLEIVIFSYNSQRTFPWILETFELEPIHFYKVIEIIIRNEDSLARDVVKHLQRIEEQVLESRAWTSDSSLWALMEKDPLGVPTCEEVSLPGQQGHPGSLSAGAGGGHIIPPGSGLMDSPLSHHKRPFSVKSPMAADRFKSPVVTAVARRQLAFGDNENQIVPTSPVRAGQSLLSSPQKPVIQLQGESSDAAGVVKAKRPGSLGLFFRKVYHLAHLRLDLLCQTLTIPEEEKRKIFTTFEHTLVKNTDLMRDRHLDQLLMCSLYIVCKVVGQNKNFTDIMKHYKEQPQAVSHVYRSVLLGPKKKEEVTEGASNAPLRPPPTPTRVAGSSSMVAGEERGDLIKFYNSTFMTRLQEFSLRFKRSRVAEAPPLSPLPKLRAHPQSPCRKVSENHSVFIRPLKATPGDVVSFNPQSPHKPLSYSFSRSPAKDLAAINALMRVEVEKKSQTRKRLLADDGPETEVQTSENNVAISQEPGQMILVQDGDGPPVKMQIVQAPGAAAPAAAGAVNTKLELILGDRNSPGAQ